MVPKLKVTVKAFFQDNRDGSSSVTLYRDKGHFIQENKYNYDSNEEVEEAWDRAEEGISAYDYGVISEEQIELELIDGKLVLVGSPCFILGR